MVAGAVPFAADTEYSGGFDGLNRRSANAGGTVLWERISHVDISSDSCAPSQYGSTLVTIPAPGTENDDHNPPRIAPRHLFDLAVGDDNLFRGDKYKWSLRLTAINVTNKVALYNFLSTFSGTHFLTPRSYTAELGFHF